MKSPGNQSSQHFLDEIESIEDFEIAACPEKGIACGMLLRVTIGMTSGNVKLALFRDGSNADKL